MLSSEDVDRIRDLVGAVAESDGEQPLNEEATLALAGSDPATSHFLQHEAGRVVGYAQSNARHATAQLLVHPERRRQGLGGQLLHDVAGVSVWAFGDLPPIDTVLVSHGHYAAAFDWHPEQRHFSRADAEARMAEPWFDPDGLLVTEDAEGLTGFHWTKRHPDGRGEVYILATHPRGQGTGLGRRLLAAGLDHLSARGCPTVHLYVEASNARAVQLYERAGFAVVHSDVLYGPSNQTSQESP